MNITHCVRQHAVRVQASEARLLCGWALQLLEHYAARNAGRVSLAAVPRLRAEAAADTYRYRMGGSRQNPNSIILECVAVHAYMTHGSRWQLHDSPLGLSAHYFLDDPTDTLQLAC